MKYYALLTKLGENLLAQATALGTKIELTQMAVGDGGGKLPTPDTNQTKLIAEKRRAAINTLFIDDNNKNQIVAEQIIPEQEGGWWIREIGLFDKAGNLIAVANCPETYKPQLAEGSGRTQSIRMVLIVSHTESVTLKIDPSVVLATRDYVNNEITSLDKKFFPKKGGVLDGYLVANHISVKTLSDAVNLYSPLSDNLLGYFQYNNNKNEWFGRLHIPKLPINSFETLLHTGNISNKQGSSTNEVPSLALFYREINQLQPSGDYATKEELTTGLGKKLDTASITQTSGTSTTQVPSVNAVTIWMEDRYSKAASDARYFPKTGGVLNGSLNATSLSVKTLADTVNFYAPNTSALMGYFQYNEGSNWGGRVQIPRLPLNAIETILHSGNVKQSLGDSTSDVLSQNAVKNLLIGFGQKYSNVTQSRSKSTKYVNTTGKPITILISAFYLGSGSGITAVLQVDGVDFNFRSGGTGTDNAYKGLSITAIIPEGSSYMLTSALGTIESWVELR